MKQGLNPEEYRKRFTSINCMHCLLLPSAFYMEGIVESILLHPDLLLIVHDVNSQKR